MIDRGAILEKYVRHSGVNVTKLSDKLPWTTKTIYRHFLEPELPLDKLMEYSRALKHDFSEEIPELKKVNFNTNEPIGMYNKLPHTDSYYRDKYEELLEEHRILMKKYNSLLEERLLK